MLQRASGATARPASTMLTSPRKLGLSYDIRNGIFCRFSALIACHAAVREERDRQRALFPHVARGRARPHDRFEPHQLAGHALDARKACEVDGVVLQHRHERAARLADHAHFHARMHRGELAEYLRQQRRDVVVRHADRHAPADLRAHDRRPRLVAHRQHPAAVFGERATVVGGCHIARVANEQRFAERILQRLDLHAHRGRRPVHRLRALRERSGLRHGHHHRQHIEIELFHVIQKI